MAEEALGSGVSANTSNGTISLEDAEEADLWYIGMILQILSTFFGAVGNLFIKQSFTVQKQADSQPTLSDAERRRAKLVAWGYWILGGYYTTGSV